MKFRLYIILAISHLVISYCTDFEMAHMVTKMLLMPVLAYYLYQKTDFRFPILIVALGFACLGDTFLLFVQKGEQFFLLGLASFFVMQLLYAIAFWRYGGVLQFNAQSIIIGVISLFFLFDLLSVLIPNLPAPLLIPVICYASMIALMCVSTSAQQTHLAQNWNYLWIGAAFFMFSDACIALTKFLPNLEQKNSIDIFVMPTYILAQALIVWSFSEAVEK